MFTRLLVRSLEWLLIGILGFMVILVFGNVVLRYGFNSGIMFSEEVSRFLFVWMVFLGSVLMLRDNGHLGVHTITKMLPPAGKKICKFLGDSLTLACCVLLTIGGWQVPLFRTGFRMVVFSVLLMAVVLFFRRGLMGNREFSWNGLLSWPDRKRRRPPAQAPRSADFATGMGPGPTGSQHKGGTRTEIETSEAIAADREGGAIVAPAREGKGDAGNVSDK